MKYVKRWRTAAVILALFSTVACAGKGCSCVTPIKGGFPVAERHENAIQLRATSGLFDFLSQNGPALVPKLLPGGSMFNVPPSCGTNKVCCAMPAPMCRINILPQKLSLLPTPPDAVHMVLTTQLITLDKLPVEFSASFLGTAKCFVSFDTTKGTAGHTDVDLVSDLTFTVNGKSDLTELLLKNTAVNNLDGSMLTLESQPGDFLCTIANFGPIKSFVVGQLSSQLAGQLGSTVENQLCLKCTDKTDCPSFAADCASGKCVDTDMKTCFQEIGLKGKMNAGGALAKFSPGLKAYLDILAAAGAYAHADTGLSLGALGGGLADPHSPCVPMLPPPGAVTVPQSTTFDTDLLPDGATPYHLGIGVHVSHLDRLGFAAWDAGALCLNVGTPSVALLSSKTIGVIIGSLSDLTHGADVPMFLVMRPAQPPTFTLGAGTFVTDPMTGVRSVADPLLHIDVPNFAIDFYAFIDERYVRIMTLNSDLKLGVSLDVDANGKIVPILGDLKKAFTNLTITNSQLLAETPSDLAAVFPTLLGVAVGQLSNAIPGISLPTLMGLKVTPLAMTSTDPGVDGTNQFLSIFANLSVATSVNQSAHTTAELLELSLPSTAEFAVGARSRRAVEPRATLLLGGRGLDNTPLEWSWSLDDGNWSAFSTETRVTLSDPVLWLQGRHHVDVRARAVGLPETLDPSPARLELLVDTIAPTGTVDELPGGLLAIRAEDNVSAPESLVYRWAAGSAPPSAWSSSATLRVPAGIDVAAIQIQARDEAGNVGTVEFHGRTTNPPATGCGCDVGGAPAKPPGTLWLIAAALGLALGRRRLWLFAAVLAGCNSGGLGKGDFAAPTDEIGRYSDVAAHQGVLHVSAYDDTLGDLVYTHVAVADVGKPLSWQVLDGVDTTLKPDKPGGYRGGISDPGPDVGLYTSIALTAAGEPRIAYYDATNRALKLASGPGHFHTITIDSAGSAKGVDVGRFAALSLDAHDVPSVAYMVTGLGDGKGNFHSELRLAVASSPSPQTNTDWTITTVDSTRISCAGRCSSTEACIQAAMVNMMPNGDPSISTCTAVDAAPCPSACTAGKQACIMGACVTALPEVKTVDLPEGTGLFTQARRTAADALVLVYYDHSQGDLKLATQSKAGGAFAVSFIDGNDPSTDVGQFCSARLAPDGTVHVAYVDAIGDRLLYKTVAGGVALMTPEVIDDGTRPDGPHAVGGGAALILDGSSPRVVYQDQRLAAVLQARRSTSWSHDSLLAGLAGYGWWPRLIADGGKIWMTEFVYDRQNGPQAPLGTFQISGLP